MIQTFIEEFKYLWNNKWKLFAWLMALFIPFTYGFLYLNAYWAPFKHTDTLHIAVVSREDTSNGKPAGELMKSLTSQDGISVSNQHYSIYQDASIANDPEAAVESGKYAAVIIIPKGYNANMEAFLHGLVAGATSSNLKIDELEKTMSKNILATDGVYDRLTFYNSYKNNYLSGEMTNFLAGSFELVTQRILTAMDPSNRVIKLVKDMMLMFKGNGIHLSSNASPLLIEKTTHGRISTYGYGLSPYFISIALFAGSLVMVFIVKNTRHNKETRTRKNYWGKWLFWVFSGWLQTLILITAITLQGVDLGKDQWMIYLFALFVATIFASLVQALTFMIRYSDIGEFAVVLILVLQLISCSGTFPVEMQHKIFQWAHPFVPFTYTVRSIREMFYQPDAWVIIKSCLILLIYPAVLVPLSLFINYRWDKKNSRKLFGKRKYKSFEIHLGDY